jgi:hypothetical protein
VFNKLPLSTYLISKSANRIVHFSVNASCTTTILGSSLKRLWEEDRYRYISIKTTKHSDYMRIFCYLGHSTSIGKRPKI